MRDKRAVLTAIPGIGEVLAGQLLVLLPELGTLSRRQIAALAGVAPRAQDSGKRQGYRRTGYGRMGVKPMLFLAAMAARRTKNSLFQHFYEHLLEKGKAKMVALVVLTRKILVIANARLKNFPSS